MYYLITSITSHRVGLLIVSSYSSKISLKTPKMRINYQKTIIISKKVSK